MSTTEWPEFPLSKAYSTCDFSPSYGRIVRWRDFDGTHHFVEVSRAGTMGEADFAALRAAVKNGYTRRRWYQFWRWWEQLEAEEYAYAWLRIHAALMAVLAFLIGFALRGAIGG